MNAMEQGGPKNDSNNKSQNRSEKKQDGHDLQNFKGIYFGDENEKYNDPSTGAHFNFNDVCKRLKTAQIQRKEIEKLLNIQYSDDS